MNATTGPSRAGTQAARELITALARRGHER